MQERQAVQEKKKALNARRVSNKRNGKIASQDEFKAATGKEWHTATIRKGTYKPSTKAEEEMKRLNSLSGALA